MSAVIFRGKLLTLVRKGYAEIPEMKDGKQVREPVLDDQGKPVIYTDKSGKTRTRMKVKKKKLRNIDAIFRAYNDLVNLDETLLTFHGRALKNAKKGTRPTLSNLKIAQKITLGEKALKAKFKGKFNQEMKLLTKQSIRLTRKIEKVVVDTYNKDGYAAAVRSLNKLLKGGEGRNLVNYLSALVAIMLKFLFNIEVDVKPLANKVTKARYFQFSIAKKIESQFGQDDATRAETIQKMIRKQDADIQRDLEKQGFIVETKLVFAGGVRELVKVAYRQGYGDLTPVPKPDPFRLEMGITREQYENSPEVVAYKAFTAEADSYIEQVLSSRYLEEGFAGEEGGGRSYRSFESLEDFQQQLEVDVAKEQALADRFPTMSAIDRDKGLYQMTFSSSVGEGHSFKVKNIENPNYVESEEEARIVELTDGSGRGRGLRRSLKVRKALVNGKLLDVISEGKYKGFLVEDMFNVEGRLIEGSFMVRLDGKTVKRDMVRDGEVNFTERKLDGTITSRLLEPYITLSESKDRLVIGIPSSRQATVDRKTMARLAEQIATIEGRDQIPVPKRLQKDRAQMSKDEKSELRKIRRNNTENPFYYFRAEDYETIRDALGSVAMSKSAADFLDRYFDQLTRRERALNEENLANFTAESIGGFVEEFNGKPFRINNKQKEALAWMDANDYSGLMALDTGVGKTLFSVGAIRKAMASEEGAKRRFLFVSPDRLKGNIEKEIVSFCKGEAITNDDGSVEYTDDVKETLERVDELNYKEFTALFEEKGTNYFKKTYFACFFDEVNEALKGKKFKALSGLRHPRKVLLTASALEKEPTDLYRFVTLAQGVPYSKKQENAWAERYTSTVGGRRIGVTSDPKMREEFMKWVKANAYFADKQDVNFTEIGRPELPCPKTRSITIKMDDRVAREYRKVAKDLSREIKAMLDKYRDEITDEENYTYEEYAMRRGRRQLVRRTIKDLAKVALPKEFRTLLKLASNPEDLIEGARNPKIEECANILKADAGARVVFFTSDNKLAKKTAMANASTRPATIHAVLLPTRIDFYGMGERGGKAKRLATVNKKTDFGSSKWDDMARAISKMGSEDEEEATWAIQTAKNYIAENNYVSTIVCTDAYAKGFNFQKFQKVVHLDRGKGFDSELLKQRTARVYRTGQEAEVEEIYLDASLVGSESIEGLGEGEVSVQELQRLLNSTDQEFFQEIIKGGMEADLTSSLDAVEKTTGLDTLKEQGRSVSGDMIKRLLDPTPSRVAEFAQKEALKEQSPLTALSAKEMLDPSRFDDLLSKVETQITDVSLIKMLLDVSNVSANPNTWRRVQISWFGDSASVTAYGYGGEHADRAINLGGDMTNPVPTSIYNELFQTYRNACSPAGIGARAVFSQVASFREASGGVGSLTLSAAGRPGGGTYIGYKIWPKFGYDGTVRYNVIDKLTNPEHKEMADYFKRANVEPVMVSDFLKAVNESGDSIGVDWWDNNGTAFSGSFDISDNSPNMKVLNDYFKLKCQEEGLEPEDYLKQDIPPFNLASGDCWFKAIASNGRDFGIEDLEGFMKKYSKELKVQFYKDYEKGGVKSIASMLVANHREFAEKLGLPLTASSAPYTPQVTSYADLGRRASESVRYKSASPTPSQFDFIKILFNKLVSKGWIEQSEVLTDSQIEELDGVAVDQLIRKLKSIKSKNNDWSVAVSYGGYSSPKFKRKTSSEIDEEKELLALVTDSALVECWARQGRELVRKAQAADVISEVNPENLSALTAVEEE